MIDCAPPFCTAMEVVRLHACSLASLHLALPDAPLAAARVLLVRQIKRKGAGVGAAGEGATGQAEVACGATHVGAFVR